MTAAQYQQIAREAAERADRYTTWATINRTKDDDDV